MYTQICNAYTKYPEKHRHFLHCCTGMEHTSRDKASVTVQGVATWCLSHSWETGPRFAMRRAEPCHDMAKLDGNNNGNY